MDDEALPSMSDDSQALLPGPPVATAPTGLGKDAGLILSITVAFLIVTAIVVSPFLTTRYVTQDDSQVALLSWRELWRSCFESARVTGRVYFLLASWFGWIPYAVDHFVYFKAVQMIGVLGNFLALFYVSWKLTHSRPFALFALLVGLVTTQARWEHNLVTAFPWAFSTSLTLAMVAIGLFAEYVDRGDKRKRLLSACFFFLSLFTYESFLLYAIAFPLLAWTRQGIARGAATMVRAVWPHALLGGLFVVAYVGFRLAYPTAYGGNQMRFSPAAMFAVWKTFGRSALPATAFADQTGLFDEFSGSYSGYVGGLLGVLKEMRVEWVILVILVALLCWFLLPRATESQGIRLGRASIVGLVMASVPQIPHALAPQYQEWVALGVKSHVPTYLAGFGVALLLSCALTAVARAVRRRVGGWGWTACVALGLAYISLLTAFSNFYVAKSQTIAGRKWDLIDAVLRSEAFRSVPDGGVLLAPSWWHGVNIMQVLPDYWTRYVRKNTGRQIQVVRTLPALRAACGDACEGRAFFAKYASERRAANQYVALAPLEGDPEKGLAARMVDVFVLSDNRWLSMFFAVRGDTDSTVTIDGVPVTDSAKGGVWVPVDRRGQHQAPFSFRIQSQPEALDPDSVVLSDYLDGDRFVGSVRALFGDGFYGEERSGAAKWNWAQEQATLIVRNESSLPREATVSLVVSGTAPSCHVTLEQAGAKASTSDRSPAEHSVTARMGPWEDTEIHFKSDCPRAPGDPRNLRFNVHSIRISETPSSGRQQ